MVLQRKTKVCGKIAQYKLELYHKFPVVVPVFSRLCYIAVLSHQAVIVGRADELPH